MNATTGKSVYACYLLYRLRQDYPNACLILVDYKRANHKFMMFSTAGVQVGATLEAFGNAVDNPNNWIIFDMGGEDCPSVPGSGLGAKVIVLSSANAKHFDVFNRRYQ